MYKTLIEKLKKQLAKIKSDKQLIELLIKYLSKKGVLDIPEWNQFVQDETAKSGRTK